MIDSARQAGLDDHDVRRVAGHSHLANTVFNSYINRGGSLNMTKLLLDRIVTRELGHQILETPYEFRLEKLELLKLTPAEAKELKNDATYIELDKKVALATDDNERIKLLAKRKSRYDTLSKAKCREKRQSVFSKLEQSYEIDQHGQRHRPSWFQMTTKNSMSPLLPPPPPQIQLNQTRHHLLQLIEH